jgi:hypothetical protein
VTILFHALLVVPASASANQKVEPLSCARAASRSRSSSSHAYDRPSAAGVMPISAIAGSGIMMISGAIVVSFSCFPS